MRKHYKIGAMLGVLLAWMAFAIGNPNLVSLIGAVGASVFAAKAFFFPRRDLK